MYLTILLFCIFFNIKVVYSINDEFKCSGSLKECLINEGLSSNDLVNIEKIVFNNKTNNIITDFDNELDISLNKDNSVIAGIKDNILYIQFEGVLYLNTNSNSLFKNFKKVNEIIGLEFVNTSKVVDMSSMFYGMNSIKELNLDNFNTSKVEDMNSMFNGMNELDSLDISNFNIDSNISTNSMFKYCKSLKEIMVGNINNDINIPVVLYDDNNNEYNNLNGITKGTNLYKKYEVRFNELDITNDILYNHVFGELPSISKIDNIFNGWYTSNDIKITSDSIFNYDNDITLYPSFTDISTMFKDVKKTDWYYNDIKYVYDKKVILGYTNGNYGPNDDLTRAMIVTILHRMENEEIVDTKNRFWDMKDNTWYSNAVDWGFDKKIIYGYRNGCFKPYKSIARQELIAILYRYAIYKGKEISIQDDITNFKDYNDIDEYVLDAMKWAVKNNILYGNKDGYLKPKDGATRAQVAAIIKRYMEN